MRMLRRHWPLLAVAAATALIQAFLVMPGYEWVADDYASYIHNAQALIHGGPYALPGYVPDLVVEAGPGAYPPGYPLLLTPAIAAFGTGMVAIRIYNLLFAAGFVLLFMVWLRPVTGLACTLAAGALVGLSPFVTSYKEVIGSEFACFLLLWLWLLIDRRWQDDERRIRASLLTALPLSAAILTRLAVALAIAAAPLAYLLRRRKLSAADLAGAALTIILVTAGVLLVTPHIIDHYLANVAANGNAEAGVHTEGLARLVVLLRDNAVALPGRISAVWSIAALGEQPDLHALGLLRKAVTFVLVLAGFAGVAAALRRGPRTPEIFFILQLGFLLVLPSQMTSPRLYVMLSLLLIYYAFVLASCFPKNGAIRWAMIGLLLAGSVPSWIAIAATPPDRFTVYEPRAQAYLDWIRRATPPDAVLLTDRPRATSLFTGRGSSDWHQPHADADFFSRARQLHAQYISFSIDRPDSRRLDRLEGGDGSDASLNRRLDQVIGMFFGARAGDFTPVFRNERFRVFRLPLGSQKQEI